MIEVDYKKYTDYTNPKFLKTLVLSEEELRVMSFLFRMTEEANPLFIPNLQIESLVNETQSPYGVIKTLYGLGARRIVLDCSDGSNIRHPNMSDEATPEVYNKDAEALLEEHGLTEDEPIGFRSVMLNLEYPVSYYCFREDCVEKSRRGEDYDIQTLARFYNSIPSSSLSAELLSSGYYAMLDFLNYMQGLYGQPKTTKEGVYVGRKTRSKALSVMICQAAEDWLCGMTDYNLASKYNRSPMTIWRWRNERQEWKDITNGRTRRKVVRRYPTIKRYDFDLMGTVATRWVYNGMPPANEFAKTVDISSGKLMGWMETSFWKIAVAEAIEYRKRSDADLDSLPDGGNIPRHLLDQAILLTLGGWSVREIEPAVNRCARTINRWKGTKNWAIRKEELLLDRIRMMLLQRSVKTDNILEVYNG